MSDVILLVLITFWSTVHVTRFLLIFCCQCVAEDNISSSAMCVIINAVSSFEIITFERMLFLILSKAAHIPSIFGSDTDTTFSRPRPILYFCS